MNNPKDRTWPIFFLTLTLCLAQMAIILPLSFASPETFVSVINPKTGNNNFFFHTDTTSVGYEFRVLFKVFNVVNLASWQISLKFNPDHLTCLNVSIPPDNVFAGKVILAPDPLIDNTQGTLLYGATTFPLTKFSGSGNLCQAYFKIKKAPPPGQTLTSQLELVLTPPYRTFLENYDGDEIPFTPQHGNYQYASPPPPPPPPPPLLKIRPEKYAASHKGEIFDVNITINNLNSRWKLIAIQFRVRFDPSILKVINMTEGPFMKQFPQPGRTPEDATLFVAFDDSIYGYNYTVIGVVLLPEYDAEGNAVWSVFPEGSGTIATITFNVTSGPRSCPLELFDVMLLDYEDNEIPYQVEHGFFDFPFETLTFTISWTDPKTGETHVFTLQTISNSSISEMEFSQLHRCISFKISGPESTNGFCNITIPKRMLDAELDQWLVLLEGWPVPYTATTNNTHTCIHFTYTLTTKRVYIFGVNVIPEFPLGIFLLAFLITAVTTTAATKEKVLKKLRNQTTSSDI